MTNSTAVQLFNFQPAPGAQSNQIRVVEIDGEPWFVAADVFRALGIDLSSTTSRYMHFLRDDEVRFVSRSDVEQINVSFPNRGVNCVSESGLYKLVMRSDKPQAKPFQNWVTQVVLPAIRKDGACAVPGLGGEMPQTD